jgi:hypothetical protein
MPDTQEGGKINVVEIWLRYGCDLFKYIDVLAPRACSRGGARLLFLECGKMRFAHFATL